MGTKKSPIPLVIYCEQFVMTSWNMTKLDIDIYQYTNIKYINVLNIYYMIHTPHLKILHLHICWDMWAIGVYDQHLSAQSADTVPNHSTSLL